MQEFDFCVKRGPAAFRCGFDRWEYDKNRMCLQEIRIFLFGIIPENLLRKNRPPLGENRFI